MEKYNEGDVVRLKSGGPIMTVGMVADDGDLLCQWFTDNKLQESFFNPNSLEKVE